MPSPQRSLLHARAHMEKVLSDQALRDCYHLLLITQCSHSASFKLCSDLHTVALQGDLPHLSLAVPDTSVTRHPPTHCRAALFLLLAMIKTSSSLPASKLFPLCCRTAHYLSLVVAENPVEAHREWRRKQVGT